MDGGRIRDLPQYKLSSGNVDEGSTSCKKKLYPEAAKSGILGSNKGKYGQSRAIKGKYAQIRVIKGKYAQIRVIKSIYS